MFIATVIVSLIFAAALTASAVGKFTQQESPMAVMDTVGFPRDKVWLLGVAEVAGAVGLIIGLWWWPLGVAAAIGTLLYFVGAIIAHVRVGDKQIAPAVALAVFSIVIIVLRVLSA